MATEKTTILDIARLTGLSKGTVDRVLHNRGEVSRKSYEKVMAVVREKGYKPNPYAALLAKGEEKAIALLLPSHSPGSYWDLATSEVDRLAEEIGAMGISIVHFRYNQYDPLSFQQTCRNLLESCPSGVVIAPMYKEETLRFTALLSAEGIPYVFIDTKLETEDYLAYFGIPAYKSGYLCADMLCQGKKITDALMIRIRRDKQQQSDPTVERRAGFLDYMQEHHPRCTVRSLFIDPSDPSATDDILEAFFTEFPKVRHLVMFNSRIHLVVPFLERHPEKEFRVVGFDNLEANVDALIKGTVNVLIAQHPERQVSQAIRALAEHIVFKREPGRKDNYMHMDLLTRYNAEDY